MRVGQLIAVILFATHHKRFDAGDLAVEECKNEAKRLCMDLGIDPTAVLGVGGGSASKPSGTSKEYEPKPADTNVEAIPGSVDLDRPKYGPKFKPQRRAYCTRSAGGCGNDIQEGTEAVIYGKVTGCKNSVAYHQACFEALRTARGLPPELIVVEDEPDDGGMDDELADWLKQ